MVCETCNGSGSVSGEIYLGVMGTEPCPECDGKGGVTEPASAAERIAARLLRALKETAP